MWGILLQNGGSLIVQEMVIPPPLDQLGNENGDLLVRAPPLYLQNVIDNGRKDVPIARRQHNELRRSYARVSCRLIDEPAPFLTEYQCTFTAVHVHGAHMWRYLECETQCLLDDQIRGSLCFPVTSHSTSKRATRRRRNFSSTQVPKRTRH